jgi:hypothetical protein
MTGSPVQKASGIERLVKRGLMRSRGACGRDCENGKELGMNSYPWWIPRAFGACMLGAELAPLAFA